MKKETLGAMKVCMSVSFVVGGSCWQWIILVSRVLLSLEHSCRCSLLVGRVLLSVDLAVNESCRLYSTHVTTERYSCIKKQAIPFELHPVRLKVLSP